jgi:hypothetical protein
MVLITFRSAVMLQVAGAVTDWVISKGHLTKLQARKFFCCPTFLFDMACLLLAAFFVHPVTSVAFITLGMAVSSFVYVNSSPNYLDIAPPFAGLLIAISNTFATFSGMISPVVTGFIVTDGVRM